MPQPMCITARGSRTGCPACSIPAIICRDTPRLILLSEKLSPRNTPISVDALNVANRRVQLDNSLTFGGFHWNDPRQIYMEFRYRFHY
jgi:hypothetical protein